MNKNVHYWLIFFLTLASFVSSADTDFSHLTLQGIKTVAVQIDEINPDYRRYDLDQESLLRSTEEQLKNAGFTIISVLEALKIEEVSLLKISLDEIKSDFGFSTYAVRLDVKEKIPLPRREGAFISATIWNAGIHGSMRHDEVNKIRTAVTELLTMFINEHRQQNTL